MRAVLAAVTALLVCAGCASRDEALPLSPRTRIVPRVDAHQHLMSAAAQALTAPEPDLPAIDLPLELANLLAERERVAGNPPVGPLFSDDAVVVQIQEGRWWQGRVRVDSYNNSIFKGVRFEAKAYASGDRSGWISGTVRAPGATTDNLTFMLGLTRSASGRWQIASEALSEVRPPAYDRVVDADAVVEVLDDAGIRYGVLLSVAYWFGNPTRNPPVQDELGKTRTENDWTVAEASRHPNRLIPFCSVNPVRDYAIAELERCAAMPAVRGMKVHLANSRIDLRDAYQLGRLREFFRAANRRGLAIVMHARTQFGFGPEHAAIVLNELLPAAPDVPVQIAHMASSWEAAAFFADAIAAGDRRTRNLYFDVTQAVPIDIGAQTPARRTEMVATLRRIGLDRIFHGSDLAVGSNPSPREWWKAMRALPLTDDELRTIAGNLPPYIR